MNIQLEKSRIIKQFEQINDVDLIKAIKSLLDYSYKNKSATTDPEVPEWHKDIVRKRLAEATLHPENLLTWDDVMQELKDRKFRDVLPIRVLQLP